MSKMTRLLDILRATAIEGLNYANNFYDMERYKKILELAKEEYCELTRLEKEVFSKNFHKEQGQITPKTGVDAAVTCKDKILLLKRNDDSTWCLPGGWLDVGETMFQGAVREVKEETGLDVIPRNYAALTEKGPDTHAKIVYHQINVCIFMEPLCEEKEVVISHEHKDYKWVSFEELNSLEIHTGHEKIIDKIFTYLKGNREYLTP